MKRLVCTETDPTHADVGKLFAVDPADASGIPVATWRIGNARPIAGTTVGEAFLDTSTHTGWVWTNAGWSPIVQSSILAYADDAAVYTDTTQVAGAYGVSKATGNMFVMSTTGWRQVGARVYASLANANAETNVSDGSLAWLQAEQVMVVRDNSLWQRLVDTPRMSVGAVRPSAPIAGDMNFNPTTRRLEIWSGTVWEDALYYGATIGDIKQSWLTETQFQTELGTIEGPNWVLADGRSAAGTRFGTVTGLANIPDLRGAFLRAAGTNGSNSTWVGGAHRSWKEDSTSLPNTAFTTDARGKHRHVSGVVAWGGTQGAQYDTVDTGVAKNLSNWTGGSHSPHSPWTNYDGEHTHTIAGGDSETAPRHYAINTYIKVN